MTSNNIINKETMYNDISVKRWVSSLRSIATEMIWCNVDDNIVRQIESIANKIEAEENDDRQYLCEKIALHIDRKD